MAIASASSNQAAPRARSHHTRFQASPVPQNLVQKNRHAFRARDQNYRGRFRALRKVAQWRSYRVDPLAESTISYAQRAAIPSPVAKTFPQRALQDNLSARAVQTPHCSLSLCCSLPLTPNIGSDIAHRAAPRSRQATSQPLGPRGGRRPTLGGPGAPSAPAVNVALYGGQPEAEQVCHEHGLRHDVGSQPRVLLRPGP
jgi:hypothetical protein